MQARERELGEEREPAGSLTVDLVKPLLPFESEVCLGQCRMAIVG